jgi:hypothetical protein
MLYKNVSGPGECREPCASGSTANDDGKESRDEQMQIVRETSTRGSGAHQGRGGRREVEAAEEGRRKEERDAKLRRSQDEKAEGEERRAKDLARRSWKARGGKGAAFDEVWPSMWEEMLKRRTADADRWAREVMARSSVSRI